MCQRQRRRGNVVPTNAFAEIWNETDADGFRNEARKSGQIVWSPGPVDNLSDPGLIGDGLRQLRHVAVRRHSWAVPILPSEQSRGDGSSGTHGLWSLMPSGRPTAGPLPPSAEPAACRRWPHLPLAVLAERAGEQIGKRLDAAAAREALQRGHTDFAELLVQKVARSLGDPARQDWKRNCARPRPVSLLSVGCDPARA